MFTTWQQVEDWIRDNHFDKWYFSLNKPGESEKMQRIVDSEGYGDDFEDKIQMTKKYLEAHGGHSWGVGVRKPNISNGGIQCEVRLAESYTQPTQGIGGDAIVEMENRIRKQMMAEIEAQRYKDERTAFEKEKREFEKKENSVWGMIVGKLGPAALDIMQGRRMVAGVDTEEPVHAAPIVADEQNNAPANEEPEETSPFTDEEADELFTLMARFKKAEPDCYLQMIRKVGQMAESGDDMYAMAKKFLV